MLLHFTGYFTLPRYEFYLLLSPKLPLYARHERRFTLYRLAANNIAARRARMPRAADADDGLFIDSRRGDAKFTVFDILAFISITLHSVSRIRQCVSS